MKQSYRAKVTGALAQLGLPPIDTFLARLPLQREARSLASVGRDINGREQRLTPLAARAWARMRAAARDDGITLQLVSAFRSVDRQVEIIGRRLAGGATPVEILRLIAAPGFSEHHTGRAVDVTTPGAPVVDEAFEETAAFAWLAQNAATFRFAMSYPRGNPQGYVYEPWHWCYRARARPSSPRKRGSRNDGE